MTRFLIDSNVLLRSAANTSARNPSAAGAITILLAQGDELLLAPQVLMELWSVATRPVAVNGLGWPVDAVRDEIDKLLTSFRSCRRRRSYSANGCVWSQSIG